jgi:hypothetical protein
MRKITLIFATILAISSALLPKVISSSRKSVPSKNRTSAPLIRSIIAGGHCGGAWNIDEARVLGRLNADICRCLARGLRILAFEITAPSIPEPAAADLGRR